MGLENAIEHGKEHRKEFRGSQAVDVQCRHHGSCSWCHRNRVFSNLRRAPVPVDDQEMGYILDPLLWESDVYDPNEYYDENYNWSDALNSKVVRCSGLNTPTHRRWVVDYQKVREFEKQYEEFMSNLF